MTKDQERVRALLTDTITLLCTNGLTFRRKLRIQGLLGITLDDDQVFIVQINETLSGPPAPVGASSVQPKIQAESSMPRERRKSGSLSSTHEVLASSECMDDEAPSHQMVLGHIETNLNASFGKNSISEVSIVHDVKPEPEDDDIDLSCRLVEQPTLRLERSSLKALQFSSKRSVESRRTFANLSRSHAVGQSHQLSTCDSLPIDVSDSASLSTDSGLQNKVGGERATKSLGDDDPCASIKKHEIVDIEDTRYRSEDFKREEMGVQHQTNAFQGQVNLNLVESGWDCDLLRPGNNFCERRLSEVADGVIKQRQKFYHSATSRPYRPLKTFHHVSRSSWHLPARRPVESAAKQFVCDYAGCNLAYYERKNLLQHQSLKHGRASQRSAPHGISDFWTQPGGGQ